MENNSAGASYRFSINRPKIADSAFHHIATALLFASVGTKQKCRMFAEYNGGERTDLVLKKLNQVQDERVAQLGQLKNYTS